MQRKVGTSHQNKPKIFLHETSLSRRKTHGMPENTGFWEAWLQIGCKNVLSICYQNDLNMYIGNAAEESAAFLLKHI